MGRVSKNSLDPSDRTAGCFGLQYRCEDIQWDTSDSCFGFGGLYAFGAGYPNGVYTWRFIGLNQPRELNFWHDVFPISNLGRS
jgi:hypothetical protein